MSKILDQEVINRINNNYPFGAIRLIKEPYFKKWFFRKGLTICTIITAVDANGDNK